MYVLEYRLQDGHGKLPKWYPRDLAGTYLGHSTVNDKSLSLVLNPKTGHVSPKFHCFFNDHFTTVSNMRNGKVPSNWSDLVERISEEILPERFSVRNTWPNQDQPPTHIQNVQQYLDRQPLD